MVQLRVRSLLAGIAAVSSSQVLMSALDYGEENASVRGGKRPLSARVERAALGVFVKEGLSRGCAERCRGRAGCSAPSACAADLCARWIERAALPGERHGRSLCGEGQEHPAPKPSGQQAGSSCSPLVHTSSAALASRSGHPGRHVITPGCTFWKKFSS